MAILQLIDQLTDALNRSWRIPLSSLCVVDTNQIGHMVERMRISVPSAIMESERTLAERDQILADAHSEAERILQDARQQVAELVNDQSVVIAARNEAERILEEGRATAARRAQEADQYAIRVLEELANKLQTISTQVDNGVQVMRNNRLAAQSPTDSDGRS
jgi:vacuolar-type H+-ATPase subunit H